MGGTGHDFVEMIEVVEAARADDNEHSLRWPQGLDSPAAALSYTTKKPKKRISETEETYLSA